MNPTTTVRLFVVVACVLPIVSAGCRSAKSTCEEALRLQCEAQFRCCEDEEIYRNGSNAYVRNEGECADQIVPLCAAYAVGDEAIAAGRAEFDNERADRCIAQLKERRDTCNFDEAIDDDCNDLFFTTGLVQDGDECASSRECADEGVCLIEFDPETGGPEEVNEELGTPVGECEARAGEGDSCSDGQLCKSDLYCDFVDGVCLKLRDNDEECTTDFHCASGFCDLDLGVPRCVDRPVEETETCNGRG